MSRTLGALALFIALSCAPAHERTGPPEGPRQLQLEEDEAASLRVALAEPQGPVESAIVQVNLVFSKPMRGFSQEEAEPVPEIHFEPELLGSWHWVGTNALMFFPSQDQLRLATAYTVTIPAGTRAVDGTSLAEAFRFSFETPEPFMAESTPVTSDVVEVKEPQPADERRPRVRLGAMDGFVEPGLGSSVVMGSRRVDQFEVLTRALAPQEMLAFLNTPYAERAAFPGIRRQTIQLSPGLERPYYHRMPFERVLGQARGAMLMGYSWQASSSQEPETHVVLVHSTDLAVMTRLSAAGGLAWVTRMSTGRGVPNARLSFVRPSGVVGRRFTTDAQGMVLLSEDDVQPIREHTSDTLLVAETGTDWSYTSLPDVSEYTFKTLATVFTDREIYRPGEPVYVKGWLRQEHARGTKPLVDLPITLTLRHNHSEERRVETTTNAFGGFSATLKLPAHAAPGDRWVEVSGGGPHPFHAALRVGEYRAADFTAQVAVARKSYLRGEPIQVELKGEYLFGEPMAGVEVSYSAEPAPGTFKPAGTKGFATDAWKVGNDLAQVFGTPLVLERPPTVDEYEWHELESGWVHLDGNGRQRVTVQSSFRALGPVELAFVATIRDVPPNREMRVEDRTLVHPGQFYFGVSLPTAGVNAEVNQVKPGTAIAPGVIAVDVEGKRLSGKSAMVELYRLIRRSELIFGEDRAREKIEPRKVDDCRVVTASAPVSCRVQLREKGEYVVLVRGADAQGNPLYAATRVNTRDWELPSDWSPEDEIDVEMDKPSYQHGDVARVLVKVPEPNAPVLLTLDQGDMIWHEQRRAQGHFARFEVPVTGATVKNALLTTHVTRGSKVKQGETRAQSRPSESEPQLNVAWTTLPVDLSSKRLRVAVLPEQHVIAPGGSVKVRFKVTDGEDKPQPAELAVIAVDESVLRLTGFATPEPLENFFSHRESVVKMRDSREAMGWLFTPDLDGEGLGSVRTGGTHLSKAGRIRMPTPLASTIRQRSLRGDSRTTPYFNPSVVTDAFGSAEVNVELSELLTRYRLMAVASSQADYFGSGEDWVETRLPIMTRPALPRFSRVGDRFFAGVLLSSPGLSNQPATVTVQAHGMVVEGPAQRRVTLEKDVTQAARFSFLAREPGTARLEFQVRAGKHQDSVVMEVPVKLARSPAGVAASSQEALLRHVPEELPRRGLDRGFFVQHQLHVRSVGEPPSAEILRGYAPGQQRFKASDVILGDVTVVVSTRRDSVVVEVPLPAGFEAVDTTLNLNRAEGYPHWRGALYQTAYDHREIRDDRVLFFVNQMNPGVHRFNYLARATTRGVFAAPPVFVQEMSSPEHFGRTAAMTIRVE